MRHPVSVLLTLLTAAVLGLAVPADAADKKPEEMHAGHMDACARACADCMLECESCMRHCADLVSNGKKEHVVTAGTCADCAEFCSAAAKIVAHRGPMATLICESCAKACDKCGTECEKFPDDAHMARCAKSCRDCAKSCREMVKMMSEPAK